MIIDLRGTHGSGKSWVVHELLRRFQNEAVLGEAYGKSNQHLGYFIPEFDLGILGKYSTVTSGCDGIKKVDEIVRRVELFNSQYSKVMLEGVLVSHTYQRYAELAKRIEGYYFLFLSTPLQNCVARVHSRRLEKGIKTIFNAGNLVNDWHTIRGTPEGPYAGSHLKGSGVNKTRANITFRRGVRRRMIEAGLNVEWLDWKDPFKRIRELLDES